MNLIENTTKFTHLNMPSWGVGTYRSSEGSYVAVEFENAGIKKFSKSSIHTMLKAVDGGVKSKTIASTQGVASSYAPVNTQDGTLIQYDGEPGGIAGKNVIEAFERNDSVIFNETYIIVGEHTEALKIHAMYDLTIMGDVTVQECVIHGSLTVIGTAHIANLTCYSGFICKGDLYSKNIYVGSNMTAGSIVCDELLCDGNVIIQTSINVHQNAQIAKTMVACEGIMGAGKFSATNAVANEYFEFGGEYEGKIVELETDTVISDSASVKVASFETIEEIIDLANQKLAEEYGKFPSLDEEELIEHLRDLGSIESKDLRNLPIIESLFSKLTDISYQDRIETIEEYLTVLVAQQALPAEVYSYESIDHIGKLFLPKAQKEVVELTFVPTSIKQFAKVLSMAVRFETKLYVDWEQLMDRIFQSVGLKYSTVTSMIGRNRHKQLSDPTIADQQPEITNELDLQLQEYAPVVSQIKKADFLDKKLSHTGKKFGLTDSELERMATIKIRTFGDLVKASDKTLTTVFGKKEFLASHLIQTRDKIIERLVDME